MYKRKVRVVFFDDNGLGFAVVACAYAKALGREWLEPMAISTQTPQLDGVALSILQEEGLDAVEYSQSPSPDFLAWADLLITVGDGHRGVGLPLPSHVQTRHWPVTRAPGRAAVKEACHELRRRVEGVIGGIKLLARLDPENDQDYESAS